MTTARKILQKQLTVAYKMLLTEIETEQSNFDTFAARFGSREGMKSVEGAAYELASDIQDSTTGMKMDSLIDGQTGVNLINSILSSREVKLNEFKKGLEDIKNLINSLNETE